jgi:7-carboxy-7-deazaguanine synthase
MGEALLAVRPVVAPVLDVFASRQGEGVRVGEPQVFVRFGGCNLVCDYCDTPESIPAKAGTAYGLSDLVQRVEALTDGVPGVVSLTGGEPLLHVSFLEPFIEALRRRGWKIYLETNGTLPGALVRIVDVCDWIAMDVKSPSATGRDFWEAHRWFLKQAGSKAFVKMVLTDRTEAAELDRAVDLIASVRADTPLVLQPATAFGTAGSISLQRLVSFWNRATQKLADVRILPQVHPLWQIP